MIINLSLDFNPETKKVKVLSVETPEVTTPEPVRVPESEEPQIVLGTSNYTLNPAAVKLLGVSPDTRIGINYQPIGDKEFPIIGPEEVFGCSCGNKLSKSLTVIYKGKQNERLSHFGKVFTLTPLKDTEGLFVMLGDAEPEKVPDEIEIIEDMTNHVDLKEEKEQVPTLDLSEAKPVEEFEPLTFDDDFSFDVEEGETEEDTLISEDSLSFE